MQFEWDEGKAAANFKKHGVSFYEAATLFGDPLGITMPDPDHSTAEDRFLMVGQSGQGRLILVSFAERNDRIRIINARELTRAERKAYEDAT
jgi:hypothetical protein